jgi:hypothetical protein
MMGPVPVTLRGCVDIDHGSKSAFEYVMQEPWLGHDYNIERFSGISVKSCIIP